MTLPAHVQRLADLLLQALGIDLQNGSLTLHFGEGRVQKVEFVSAWRVTTRS